MDLKRFFRGPIIYILLGIGAIALAFSLLGNTGFQQITTQEGMKLLQGSTVDEVKIVDGEQRVDLTLSTDFDGNGTLVQFYYVEARADEVVAAVNDLSGAEYTDEVPQTNVFLSALGFILPFLLIGLLFWFLWSGMQGGGNRVMQFGKSKAKLVSKEPPQVTFADVAGAEEAVEELHEIKEFLQDPPI